MKFEPFEIVEFPGFLSEQDNNVLLERLFDRETLWETRTDRVPRYKNAKWFTLGTSLYMDLKDEVGWIKYCQKLKYFNSVLEAEFDSFWKVLPVNLRDATGEEWDYAWKLYPQFAFPGFHIFPPHLSSAEFFGHKHQDLQWNAFNKFPELEVQITDHLSGTYALTLPKQGPHLLFGEDLEMDLTYKERAMYLHSGQFTHAIAPLKRPITKLDWRITLQFHAFKSNDINYLYW